MNIIGLIVLCAAVIAWAAAMYCKVKSGRTIPKRTMCDNCMARGRAFDHCRAYQRKLLWLRIIDYIVPVEIGFRNNCKGFMEVFKDETTKEARM